MKFECLETELSGVYIIKAKNNTDQRGFFYESYNQKDFEKLGITNTFVQDNVSKSKMGVLRGLHYQYPKPQAKLINVLKGKICDVVVDLRSESPTYLKNILVVLSEEEQKQLFVPRGCAHGFLSLSDNVVVSYKCDEYYYPEYSKGIMWNDPILNINWPLDTVKEIILSDKDMTADLFEDVNHLFEDGSEK